MGIGMKAMQNKDEVGAASVDYLMYSGYVTYAYLWARAALVASEALAAGTTETEFYEAKLYTAKFYYQRILPRVDSLKATMMSGVTNVLDDAVNPFV